MKQNEQQKTKNRNKKRHKQPHERTLQGLPRIYQRKLPGKGRSEARQQQGRKQA